MATDLRDELIRMADEADSIWKATGNDAASYLECDLRTLAARPAQAEEVVAWRLVRKSHDGEWVTKPATWTDGKPDDKLLADIADDPRWRIDYAYGDARAAAAVAQAVPEGWVMVTAKLTAAAGLMLSEIDTCGHEVDTAYRTTLYEAWDEAKAMLSAAPQPAAVKQDLTTAQEDPCPNCTPGVVCKTPKCGRLAAEQIGRRAQWEREYADLMAREPTRWQPEAKAGADDFRSREHSFPIGLKLGAASRFLTVHNREGQPEGWGWEAEFSQGRGYGLGSRADAALAAVREAYRLAQPKPADVDEVSLIAARQFTSDDDPQGRARMQCRIIAAIKGDFGSLVDLTSYDEPDHGTASVLLAELLGLELPCTLAEMVGKIRRLQGQKPKPAEGGAVGLRIAGWMHEDELPEDYPYDAMFPHSKVDGVRMFPVFAPDAATRAEEVEALAARIGVYYGDGAVRYGAPLYAFTPTELAEFARRLAGKEE